MAASFRLRALGNPKNLYTAPTVMRVVEHAHGLLDHTRGPLAISVNEPNNEGALHLRRHDASPEVHLTWEHNPNFRPTNEVPSWAIGAAHHMQGLRTVHTTGMLNVGRVS